MNGEEFCEEERGTFPLGNRFRGAGLLVSSSLTCRPARRASSWRILMFAIAVGRTVVCDVLRIHRDI